MVSYRLMIGIIIGVALSFVSAYIFNMVDVILQIQVYAGFDLLKVVILLIGAIFEFDIISFFLVNPSFLGFFAPQILACIVIAYIAGTISKGLKRSIITSTIIVIIDLSIWILLMVVSGEDLMALFQGAQLITTIGGLLSALIGTLIGGLIAGLVSGPHEEF